MKTKSFVLIALIFTFVVSLSGCNTIEGVKGLFASATPTTTPTSTSTATPAATSTPTLTPTPKSPLALAPCALGRNCRGSIDVLSLIEAKFEPGVQYPVTVPFNEEILFAMDWITKDQLTLDQNLQHMTPFFEIDGNSYMADQYVSQDKVKAPDGTDVYVASVGVSTVGWKLNETHTVRLGWKINDKITNGWKNFDADTEYSGDFLVKPGRVPTVTPTSAGTPTRTPLPPTATASCPIDDVIAIDNQTGATLTIFLTGPAKFGFYLQNGANLVPVCAGSYSFTAYGCGGKYLNGEIHSHSGFVLWCGG